MFIGSKATIAMIDDNEAIIEVVTLMIQESFSEDFEIVKLGSSNKALDSLMEKPVDILLLDVHMPEKFGDTFLREYKEKHKNKIVIMVSGDSTFTITSNTYLNGANYYLKKPFAAEELVAILENCKFSLDHWRKVFKR